MIASGKKKNMSNSVFHIRLGPHIEVENPIYIESGFEGSNFS